MTKNKKIAIVVTVCAVVGLIILGACLMYNNYIKEKEAMELAAANAEAEENEKISDRLRDISSEIKDIRNKIDHPETYSSYDTYMFERKLLGKKLTNLWDEVQNIVDDKKIIIGDELLHEIRSIDVYYSKTDKIDEVLMKIIKEMASDWLNRHGSAINRAKEFFDEDKG